MYPLGGVQMQQRLYHTKHCLELPSTTHGVVGRINAKEYNVCWSSECIIAFDDARLPSSNLYFVHFINSPALIFDFSYEYQRLHVDLRKAKCPWAFK